MPLSPLITSWLPTTTPGPYKSISYAHITHNPVAPHAYPSPKHLITSQPALSVKSISYAVFYPVERPKSGGNMGVYWFPEPTGEMAAGYEKFLGKKGVKWICKLDLILLAWVYLMAISVQAMKLIVGRLKVCYSYQAGLMGRYRYIRTYPYSLQLQIRKDHLLSSRMV
jgi:hypothetical protein